MKLFKLAVLGLVIGSSASFAECEAPAMPTLPNGGSATMQEMLEGQKAVKTFQTANMDYMACLEKKFTAAEEQAKSIQDDKAKAAAVEAYDKAIDAYNTAVSKEEEVVGQFNTEIREYKAANPS